jgi:hypothetical protein
MNPSPLRAAARIALLIAFGLLTILFLFVGLTRGDEAPAMPPADAPAPAIALDAPKTVPAGSGYFKVRARATGPVTFDVEAQFADPKAVFQSEQIDPTTYLIGVPASAGVIRVEAAVSVAGGPPQLAKVYVEVLAAPAGPPEPPAPPAPAPAVGKLFAIFVVDKAGLAVAESPTLLAALHAGGDERAVLDSQSPAIAAQGLAPFVASAGGAPCLVLMDEQGAVHKAVKLPADEPGVLAVVRDAHAGK